MHEGWQCDPHFWAKLRGGEAVISFLPKQCDAHRKVLCSPGPEQFERGRPSARRCASEKIFTQFFTQLHHNREFRRRKSERGRAVDSFIRKVLRSPSPFVSRSGEIGIRSRLKMGMF